MAAHIGIQPSTPLMKVLARLLLPLLLCAVTVGADAQAIYGDLQAPLAGRVYGTAVHASDAEELRYVVLQQLTDRYASDKGIVVTKAEQQAYVQSVQAGLQRDREKQQDRQGELERALAATSLPEAERVKLTAELETVKRTREALSAGASATPDEDRKAREQIGAAFIRQWKLNQALYRQYGGRIIFQQGGPEPLDAYRKFLQEQLARGNFAIYDPGMEAPFWRYYLTDSMHSFYPRGSKEEAEAFKTPWWLSK